MTISSISSQPRRFVPTGLSQTKLTLAYESDRIGFLRQCVDAHGPLVQLGPATFLVADPAMAMTVLRDEGQKFEITRILARDRSEGSRGPDHAPWLQWRDAVLSAQKDEGSLDEHMAWARPHAQTFCDRWAQAGIIDDLRGELEVLSATSFARYAYGEGTYDEVVRCTREFLAALLVIIGSPIELPGFLRILPRRRRFDRARRALEEAVRAAVPRATPDSVVGRVRDSGYDVDHLARYMVTQHAAGTVPTAVLMWALVELGRHPDVADEIARTGDSTHFVKELLRMWPATWIMMRETLEDVVADGHHFPKGSIILLSPYLIHRYAPCFQPDPDDFRPDRWEGLRPPSGSYVPFGAGPTWCVGGRFAERELNAVIPVIARTLVVELGDEPIALDDRRSLQPRIASIRVRPRG